MRVLVTGASGFTGRFMMEFLSHQQGVDPVGLVRSRSSSLILHPRVRYETSDLLDNNHISEKISSVRPDAILHLAGLTHGSPDDLLATNVTGTNNLLEAGVTANPACRILVISSSAVYGYVGEDPIAESAPLKPLSDYGRSKVAQESLALAYGNTMDAAIAVARPFNLAGPGQPDTFVCGRIIDQVIAIERGTRAGLELLEIQSSRDLTDVRDIVRGYWALVSHPNFGGDCAGKAFNLGSGNAYPISLIISLIEEITGDKYPVQLPKTPQPVPVPSQRSDNSRIAALTGWRPEYPLKETLRDMLAAARESR
jgi:GDP-4-dehydro-6-deoxy-D-mannose reductase